MQPLWAKHKTSNHQHHLDRSVQIEFLSNREWYERDKWSWNGVKSRIKHISRSRCVFFSSTPFALFIYFSSLFISYLYMCLSLRLYICVSWHMQSFPIRHNKSATKWIYHFLSLFHSIFCLTSSFFPLDYLAAFILFPALFSFSFALFFIFFFRFDLFASHGTNFTMSTEY